jgi:hypothetical protein
LLRQLLLLTDYPQDVIQVATKLGHLFFELIKFLFHTPETCGVSELRAAFMLLDIKSQT